MFISVDCITTNNADKIAEACIGKVMEFYADEISINILEVEVVFKDLTPHLGWCEEEYHGSYILSLDLSLLHNKDELILTLCHEAIHIAQDLTTGTYDEEEAYGFERTFARMIKL